MLERVFHSQTSDGAKLTFIMTIFVIRSLSGAFDEVKPEAEVTRGAAFVVARDRYGEGPQLGFGSSRGFGLGLRGLLGLLKGFRELLRGLLGLLRGEPALLRSLGEDTVEGAAARGDLIGGGRRPRRSADRRGLAGGTTEGPGRPRSP